MSIKKQLQAAYLDYLNNYLTMEVYAEHNNITITQAKALLRLGEEIHCGIVDSLQLTY